jgi:F-type H+-transporting ATPase subunit delta
MAEIATLARPYAKAVFELAIESDNFNEWSNNLRFLTKLIEDPTISAAIDNPELGKNTLINILLEISEDHLSEYTQNLVKILVDNHKLRAIPPIALQYEQLKAEHQGYIKVDIISAYSLNQSQEQEIEVSLNKRLGKSVDINIIVDKSLLGGFLIRAGDEVIDVSVKGRLEQLASELRR